MNNEDIRQKLSGEMLSIYDELLMPVDTGITIDRVILSEENKIKIEQFIKEYREKEKLFDFGLKPMNRILMYGDSGTGKTFLTKALSNHLGCPMIYIDVAKSLSDNMVAMNISRIFRLGKHLENAIIFLDECDSVAWNRDAGATSESGTVRRATNSIFQNLDQMSDSTIFVAATNMLHRLDPAFERRFNMKMEFRNPTVDFKETIKKFIYAKFTVVDDVDDEVADIVGRRDRLSYYAIEDIAYRAMKRSVIADTNVVRMSDVYRDLALAMGIRISLPFRKGEEA